MDLDGAEEPGTTVPWRPLAVRRSRWRRAADAIFGYDYFVAYARSDGRAYALKVATELEARGLDCFLDSKDYALSDDWKRVGAWTLRRTSQLLLIGSPAALGRPAVLREVRMFSRTGRRIVAVSFDGSLDPQHSSSRLFDFLRSQTLRFEEKAERLPVGPSSEAVDRIVASFRLVRQREKRLRLVSLLAAVLAAFAIVAGVAAVLAKRAQTTAEQARAVAEEQTRRAERQTRRAESGRVAADADRIRTQRPVLSLLLAAEAVQIPRRSHEPPVNSALQALYSSLRAVSGEALDNERRATVQLTTNPDSRLVAARDGKGNVRIWALAGSAAPSCVIRAGQSPRAVTAMSWTPDGRWLIIGRADGSLARVTVGEGGCGAAIEVQRFPPPLDVVELDPHGRRLLVHAGEGPTAAWSLWGWQDQPSQLAVWGGPPFPAIREHFDSAGTSLLSRGPRGGLCLGPWQAPWRCDARVATATADQMFPSRVEMRSSGDAIALVSTNGQTLGAISLAVVRGNAAKSCKVSSRLMSGQPRFAFSGTGRYLFASGEDVLGGAPTARVKAVDAFAEACGRTVAAIDVPGGASVLRSFPGDRGVVVATAAGRVFLWDPSVRVSAESGRQGRVEWSLHGFDDPVAAIEVSANSKWLIAAGSGGSLRRWNLDRHHPEDADVLDLTADLSLANGEVVGSGARLLAYEPGLKARLWSLREKTWPIPMGPERSYRSSLEQPQWSPSGRWLVGVGTYQAQGCHAEADDLSTAPCVERREEAYDLQAAPGQADDRLAFGFRGGNAVDLMNADILATFDDDERWLLFVGQRPHRAHLWLLDGQEPKSWNVEAGWRTADGEPPEIYLGARFPVFEHRGRWLAIARSLGDDDESPVWDLWALPADAAGRPQHVWTSARQRPFATAVRFLGDGTVLAIEEELDENRSRIILRPLVSDGGRLAPGKELAGGRFEGCGFDAGSTPRGGLAFLTCAKPERHLVIRLSGSTVDVAPLELPAGSEVTTISDDERLALVSSGEEGHDPLLIAAGADGGWRGCGRLAGHTWVVEAAAIASHDRYIATGTSDGGVRLTGLTPDCTPVSTFEISRHGSPGERTDLARIDRVWFDSSGLYLFSLDAGGRLRRTELDLERVLARARLVAGRSLSAQERAGFELLAAPPRPRPTREARWPPAAAPPGSPGTDRRRARGRAHRARRAQAAQARRGRQTPPG